MNQIPKNINAEIHTPEELLAGAESLLLSSDIQLMRAVVLEAITALEAYVYKTVFGMLENKIDPLLVKWLEEKTRMDFDSRLSILTPVATGHPINKTDDLWKNYKEAKAIRNKVTHSGKKVTREEAKSVVNTVYEWMAYLGSTAEIDLSLLALKKYIERERPLIKTEEDCVRTVAKYFSKTRAASTKFQDRYRVGGLHIKLDLVLRFGQNTVLIEAKFSPQQRFLQAKIDRTVDQVRAYMEEAQLTRAAIVIFSRKPLPETYDTVKTVNNGHISIVGIEVL